MELFKNKRLKHILALGFFLFLVVGTVLILRRSSEQNVWQLSEGPVFGTFYEVKYQYAEPLDEEILKSLEQVDAAGEYACSLFPDVVWWKMNWRKGGLQERRNYLIKEKQFYNQLWCGCEFSRRKEEQILR